ncbi:MAG: DUF3306 domain-containing protein [Caldimonas sp.]
MSRSSEEGFLGRWSRRKAGIAEPAPAPAEPARAEVGALAANPVSPAQVEEVPPAATELPEAPALPTLDDVARLTRSSDYSRFVRPGVGPEVRNAAMKKLFSDPHFNVMDGLDTYIGDYSQPDPIPASMLRLMNQAASLGLFDDEKDTDPLHLAGGGAAAAQACPDGGPLAALSQSPPDPAPSTPSPVPASRTDDDPDLRLQPDDAAERAGPGPGPRA